MERVWSLCWVLMEWNSDIQQTGFKACVANMKCRVNIPSGLCKPLPSASPIASVNHKPPGTGLVLHGLIDFYCGVYFILCRKETDSVHAACSAEQGREFGGEGIQTAPCSWSRRKWTFDKRVWWQNKGEWIQRDSRIRLDIWKSSLWWCLQGS